MLDKDKMWGKKEGWRIYLVRTSGSGNEKCQAIYTISSQGKANRHMLQYRRCFGRIVSFLLYLSITRYVVSRHTNQSPPKGDTMISVPAHIPRLASNFTSCTHSIYIYIYKVIRCIYVVSYSNTVKIQKYKNTHEASLDKFLE